MAEGKGLGLSGFLALLFVVAAGAGARSAYLFYYADQGKSSGPLLVESPSPLLRDLPPGTEMLGKKEGITELDALVHNIKEHSWFGSMAPFAAEEEQTAHVSPAYPWLVANAARVVGIEKLAMTVRWGQVGLGALAVGLLFLFARRAFGGLLVPLLAGLAAAVYPLWVINVASLTDGALVSFLLMLVLYLGSVAGQTGGPLSSLLYGLSLAGLALARVAMLPFAFVGLGWLLLRSSHESRGWLCPLLACLGFFNGLAPWTVRNYQVFQEIIPVADSAYLHLWIGNNPQATGGPVTESMLATASSEELRSIKSQPSRYGKMAFRVREEVKSHPEETVKRRIWAGLYLLLGEHFFKTGQLAERTEESQPPPHAGLILSATLLGLFLLALLGWRWSYGYRRDSMPASLVMVWIPLPYLLSHAGALHGPRLPLDGVLICYAALALACLIPGVGGQIREPETKQTDAEEENL